jgi:small subunit ribosomal protein S17
MSREEAESMSEDQVVQEACRHRARNDRKTRQGYVVSDKMDKTVVVEVESASSTRCTARSCDARSKVKAHDEQLVWRR